MQDDELESFLRNLRRARPLAAATADVPWWREKRNAVLARMLAAPDLRVGSGVRLDRSHPALGGTLILGKAVEIGAQSILDLSGGITIADEVTISEGAMLLTHDHAIGDGSIHWRLQQTIARPLSVRTGAWIGARAVVLGKAATIGEGAVVAAGAVVTKSVPPFAVVAGNPARIVRYRETREGSD